MAAITKAPRIIKSIRKKLFPLEIKKGRGFKDKFKNRKFINKYFIKFNYTN